MIIFTSICANYLHKARTLAKSVKDNIPDATFIICLTEKELLPQYESPYFDRIVLSKDAWEGNFDRFIFKHTIVEASTAVKGQFFFDTYIRNIQTKINLFIWIQMCMFTQILQNYALF
ncbi:hypothetical protein HMSSN036_54130 [Paenibacillus macerans]|nr:hypothetical protein HMSSN036_54130 [Paenibacillus macerans]